jgi:hypothetical protein
MIALLIGEKWDEIAEAVRTLERLRSIQFVYSECGGLPTAIERTSPALLIAAPDADRTKVVQGRDHATCSNGPPPLLACINPTQLEDDDIYEGADDFVLLPCSAAELDKRVRRLTRRRLTSDSTSILSYGILSIDQASYRVWVESELIRLAWMEFKLLKFMMQQPGRVFTRRELLSGVWETEHYGNTRTVDVHVRRLRFKLGMAGRYLRTVTNVGYGLAGAS